MTKIADMSRPQLEALARRIGISDPQKYSTFRDLREVVRSEYRKRKEGKTV